MSQEVAKLKSELRSLAAKHDRLKMHLNDIWTWLSDKHRETGNSESEYLDIIRSLQKDQPVIEDGLIALYDQTRNPRPKRVRKK